MCVPEAMVQVSPNVSQSTVEECTFMLLAHMVVPGEYSELDNSREREKCIFVH